MIIVIFTTSLYFMTAQDNFIDLTVPPSLKSQISAAN